MEILKIKTVTDYYYLKRLTLLLRFRYIAHYIFLAPKQTPSKAPHRNTCIQGQVILQKGDILSLSISQLYPCLNSLLPRCHLPQGQSRKPAATRPYFQDTQLSIVVELTQEHFCDNGLALLQKEISRHFLGLPHPTPRCVYLPLEVQKLLIDRQG